MLILGCGLLINDTFAQRPRTPLPTNAVNTSTNSTVGILIGTNTNAGLRIRSGGGGSLSGQSYIRKIVIESNSISSINGSYVRRIEQAPFIKIDNTNLIIDYNFVSNRWYISSTNTVLYTSLDLINWTNEVGVSNWGNSTSTLFYKP